MIIPIDIHKRLKTASTVLDGARPHSAARGDALTAQQRRALAKAAYVEVGPLMRRMRRDHELFNAIGFLVERPPLSEQEMVQRALHLADPNATIIQKAEAMLNFADGHLVSHDWEGPTATAPEVAENGQPAVDHWWASVAKEREQFRTAVLDLATAIPAGDRPRCRRPERKPVMKKYTPWIIESLKDIVVVPRLVWDRTRSRTELRYWTLNTKAACGFAFMLLIDDRRPLKELLRLCKPDSGGCGRPFLASVRRSGSPPSVYCSEDCRTNAKREQTAARVARLRARRAKEEAA